MMEAAAVVVVVALKGGSGDGLRCRCLRRDGGGG